MTDPANLIYFQSDNHNYRLLGCYGHPLVQTPHLDALARRGTRFANSYCASTLCCPSRASIATGRYPHQTGYWDNAIAYDGRVPSWMRRLREQGHAVVSVGKLHFRSEEADNGFCEEIVPMHLVDGVGGLIGLLRYSDEPPKHGQWELYMEETGVGATAYQAYDREITRQAIGWLNRHGRGGGKPWTLFVSYVSSHPPFTIPQRLMDLYPLERMPLPVRFRPEERPNHPALRHLRHVKGWREMTDEATLRRIAAAYFGLVTHLDEQIGEVLAAADSLGLLANTRLLYTTDHGESYGHHGLFGKGHLYEHAARVPLIMSGPGVPAGRVVEQITSHVDLFPTLVAGAGARLNEADGDLPGISLWPALGGQERPRTGFCEYHATGSKSAGFLLREGDDKLVYHVGMPSQLFDLRADPEETRDLVELGGAGEEAQRLEARLRERLDPEEVDRRAKSDQEAHAEKHGGYEAIRQRGDFVYTPPPGVEAKFLADDAPAP
ncbi:MAG: sulfatase-like hydrolase/transferase [SAR324 cluster bacterium]|nr:sulfatase-like hydrolase/transferase [SAR324 cluster bacterium]